MDNEKLRVAAWKGDVELYDIEVLADAISDTLDGPVRVVHGNVGHFHLYVPWAALGSRPVEIVIEDVAILIAPVDAWGMDPHERQRRARYAKMMNVERKMSRHMEKERLVATATTAGSTAAAREKEPGAGFWQRLIAKVFHNIQVVVRRVHIRYEDNITYPGRSMSLGLTLNEVLSQTANDEWNVSFDEVGSGRLRKLINIEDLGLYCDTFLTDGLSQVGGEEAKTDHCNMMGDLSFQEHDYVLFPLSGSARLSLGQNDVSLDLCLPSMGMSLSTDQLTNVHVMRLALKDLERWETIFRHRPLSPPTKDPRGWWKYAVWCIISSTHHLGVRRRLGWLDVVRLIRKRKEYVQFYQARLESQLMPSDYQSFMMLEDELSVHEIVAFQKTAEAELAYHRTTCRGNIIVDSTGACDRPTTNSHHPTQEDGDGGVTTTGWLGSVFGYGKSKYKQELQQQNERIGQTMVDIDDLSESERKAIGKEVIKAFSMDEEDIVNTGWYKPVATLNLNNATLTIVEGNTPCLRIVWDTKLYFSSLRVGRAAWKIEATLGGLHIFDPSAGSHGLSTILRRKRDCFYSNEEKLQQQEATVQIGDYSVVETGSLSISYTPGGEIEGSTIVEHSSVDVNLRINAHEVTYVPRCFSRTIEVFQSRELRAVIAEARYRLGGVQSHAYIAASSFLRGLALSSSGGRGGVDKVSGNNVGDTKNGSPKLEKRSRTTPTAGAHIGPSRMAFTASIHAEAPLVILLESPDDLRVGKGQLLLIDLGCVTLSPNGHDKSGKDLGWGLNLAGIEALVVPDAQAFLCDYGPSLSSIVDSSRSLIERLDVTLNLLPTVDPSSGRLNRLLVRGDLPRLSIHLHSSAFHLLRRMMNVKLEDNGKKVKNEEDGSAVISPSQLMGQLPEGGWGNGTTELSTTTTKSPFPDNQQKRVKRSELRGGLSQQDVKASLFEAVSEVEWMEELAEREEREETL